MAKRKQSDLELIIEIFIAAGLFYLLYKYITKDVVVKSEVDLPGIHGHKLYVRKLIPIVDQNNRDLILEDFSKLPSEHIGAVIRAIIRFRESPSLTIPIYRRFKETKVTGEVRYKGWRLFTYQLESGDHLFISFFQKKDNETKKQELVRAERRLSDYLSTRAV
ncbi:MAG: hypothetical protein HOP11_09605 [Saprospiraceae bacterium]|nr:hypothetical protein [Saprospiraceae bacterium]